MSQVEIGFDIIKACDVPEVDCKDGAGGISAAFGPQGDAAAAATTTPATAVSNENTAAATAAAKTNSANNAATSTPVPGCGNKEVEVVDDKRKRYRLMVKRRLLKRHGEELSTDATTRKRQLEDLYRDVEPGLLSLGTKLRTEKQDKKKQKSVV